MVRMLNVSVFMLAVFFDADAQPESMVAAGSNMRISISPILSSPELYHSRS